MRGKSAIGLIALFAATALAGCTIDGKCGTWTIEGEPIENVPGSVREEGHAILEQKKVEDHWSVVIEKK